jgi:hypothetical protein
MECVILTRRSKRAVTPEKLAVAMRGVDEIGWGEKRREWGEVQGFPLARPMWFPYNPGDFCILRVSPAGIAVANLNGQPSQAIIQEAGK